jgi:hypothetical protein
LEKADEILSAENFSEYRAARAPAATGGAGCNEMFGALAK